MNRQGGENGESRIRASSLLQRTFFVKYENVKHGNQVYIQIKLDRIADTFIWKNQLKMWPSYAGALNIQ